MRARTPNIILNISSIFKESRVRSLLLPAGVMMASFYYAYYTMPSKRRMFGLTYLNYSF